jgi:hypothetical protein
MLENEVAAKGVLVGEVQRLKDELRGNCRNIDANLQLKNQRRYRMLNANFFTTICSFYNALT